MKQAGDSEDAPSLISTVNVLKRKSEEQGEHKKLEKSLNTLEKKRKTLELFSNFRA